MPAYFRLVPPGQAISGTVTSAFRKSAAPVLAHEAADLTGLILDLGECDRGNIDACRLLGIQNFYPPGGDLNDESTVWADPRLLAAGDMDRIAATPVDCKGVPVFGFQQIPDPINHSLWLILKSFGYKPSAQHFAGNEYRIQERNKESLS